MSEELKAAQARIDELDDIVLSLQCKVIERDAELAALKAQVASARLSIQRDGGIGVVMVCDEARNALKNGYTLELFAAPVVSAEQQGVAIQRTLNGWGIVRQSDKAISIVDGSTYVTFSYDESDRRMPWLVEFLAAMLAAAPAPSTTEGQGDE